MYAGKVVEYGPTDEVSTKPIHPYTQALFGSVPNPKHYGVEQLVTVEGEVASAVNPPSGCRFHPRCSKAMDICHERMPEEVAISPDHCASCWLLADQVASTGDKHESHEAVRGVLLERGGEPMMDLDCRGKGNRFTEVSTLSSGMGRDMSMKATRRLALSSRLWRLPLVVVAAGVTLAMILLVAGCGGGSATSTGTGGDAVTADASVTTAATTATGEAADIVVARRRE